MRFIKDHFVNSIILGFAALMLGGALFGAVSTKTDRESTIGTYETSDGMFTAEVTDDEIVVWVVAEGERALYWKGSWTSGNRVSSQADPVALEAAVLGSQDSSKLFKVKGDTITFEGSMFGESFKPVLKKEN